MQHALSGEGKICSLNVTLNAEMGTSGTIHPQITITINANAVSAKMAARDVDPVDRYVHRLTKMAPEVTCDILLVQEQN